MKEKKLLQVVNLSPSEEWVERLADVHPMTQITWAAIIQVAVFGFMLLCFSMISVATQASTLDLKVPETDFDFRQIEEDKASIINSEHNLNFNIQNPHHKYFLVVQALDVASTVYAMENRNSLIEGNLLLPSKPKPEELILQKIIVISIMKRFGLFSNLPEDQQFINSLNLITTLVVANNLHTINKYD